MVEVSSHDSDSFAAGGARSRARTGGQQGWIREGLLLHTERKLKTSLTDAYRILSALAEAETEMEAALGDARRVYRDSGATPIEADRLAEAVYCSRAAVASAATCALLLAPASVTRRFEHCVERPRRLDERLPEPVRGVEFGGQPVGEWLPELLVLADMLETYYEAITVSVDRLVEVDENLPAYVMEERPFRPLAASLASPRT